MILQSYSKSIIDMSINTNVRSVRIIYNISKNKQNTNKSNHNQRTNII